MDTLMDFDYDKILNKCARILRDRDWAQDATQDVYLLVAEHWRGEGSVMAFANVVAKNHCINLLRKKKTYNLDDLPLPNAGNTDDCDGEWLDYHDPNGAILYRSVQDYPSPEEMIIKKQAVNEMHAKAERVLTAEQHAVYKLVAQGYDSNEIAGKLGITAEAVKGRRKRILANMRK